MNSPRKGAVAIATAVVAVGAMLTASTTASAAPSHTGKAADYPCWTSFDNPNANGGPMMQIYKNCSPDRVGVCAKDIEGNYTHKNGRIEIGPNGVALWYWSSTTPGHHYTTYFC
ncbi:hypothetical protein [Streptomyces sp. GS7]|uniref:hypothetical protein n=1 Tax=Streptomyces sp. GS7 TaxID=2692234 RepID=UPI0019167E00|nr:hypothetical protein [Streptomyces sp. GS7]